MISPRQATWPRTGWPQPDAAMRAYLLVIGRELEAVKRALQAA